RRPGADDFDSLQPFSIFRTGPATRPRLVVFQMAFTICKEIIKWQPTAIINLLWFPDGMASLLAKIICFWHPKNPPYFVFAHGVEVIESNRNLRKRIRARLSFLKSSVFRSAAGIWAVSRFTRNAVHLNCGVALEKVSIVHNGVDCNNFRPSSRPEALVSSLATQGKKVFLTVARLDDYKGVDNVILAMKELAGRHPNLIYCVAGAGPDRPRLEELVAEHGLGEQVRFLGKVSDKDLVDYYNLADCFMLLSREDRAAPHVEGFGIVFLEAAACGKPSIAGASGGTADAVEHGYSGWLVDPTDTAAIAARMEQIILDDKMAHQIGANGRARASSQFTWELTCQKILKDVGEHVRH
ncbi:MAG: glycosyltransferase family 4 protein, partial [Bdellovibrionota bacterium]